MESWASLPLRLGLGVIFFMHGLQKVFGLFGGKGIPGFAGMLGQLGFKPPFFWARLDAYAELILGALLVVGLFTRTASAILFLTMVVAVAAVHFPKGFFLANGGFEYNLLIMAGLLSLMIMGTGNAGLSGKF